MALEAPSKPTVESDYPGAPGSSAVLVSWTPSPTGDTVEMYEVEEEGQGLVGATMHPAVNAQLQVFGNSPTRYRVQGVEAGGNNYTPWSEWSDPYTVIPSQQYMKVNTADGVGYVAVHDEGNHILQQKVRVSGVDSSLAVVPVSPNPNLSISKITLNASSAVLVTESVGSMEGTTIGQSGSYEGTLIIYNLHPEIQVFLKFHLSSSTTVITPNAFSLVLPAARPFQITLRGGIGVRGWTASGTADLMVTVIN